MNRKEIMQLVGVALMIIGFLVFEGTMVIFSIEKDTIVGMIIGSVAAIGAGAGIMLCAEEENEW